MPQRNLLFVFLILLFGCTSGPRLFDWSKGDYNFDNLLMRINASSSVRYSETELDVLSEEKAIYTIKKAFTVFDKEDQESLSRILIWYDEFQKVNYIKANIVNSENEIVRTFTESDADDYSAFSGYTFFSDNRVKVLDLFYNSYPYTIELEYEMSLTGLLYLPTWAPQEYDQSVETAKFRLIDRGNTGVRFFQKNFNEEPEISNVNGYQVFEWELVNQTSKQREALGAPFEEVMPLVYVAPGKFKMDNSRGDATSWKSFGKWYYELGKETRDLPDEAKFEVDELLKGVNSEKEKVHVLYNYLQEKARYVSIQLGIGGWKPFDTEFVFENEYGDCKALTNYMQAILDYAGIDANPVLIKNGNQSAGLLKDFPSNQFNHVIIKVTLNTGEELWLECTSKYMPVNEIGTGNEDKYALLISEEGGKLIQTPDSKAKDNRIERNTTITLYENGEADLSSVIKNKGSYQHSIIHNLLSISESQKVKWLENELHLNNYNIKEYDFSEVKKDTVSSYSYSLEMNDYSANSSSRLFVPISKLHNWSLNLPKDNNRKQNIWFGNRFTERDSTTFIIPEGYKIESSPSNLSIETDFGEYKTGIEYQEDGLIKYVRKLTISEKEISGKDYDKFRDFFGKISETNNQRIVLVKSR